MVCVACSKSKLRSVVAAAKRIGKFMKRMTCRDLGGPCDAVFTGDSFEELGKKSHEHVMERMQRGDEAHLLAANKMRKATPEEQKSMMAQFKQKFEQAPDL